MKSSLCPLRSSWQRMCSPVKLHEGCAHFVDLPLSVTTSDFRCRETKEAEATLLEGLRKIYCSQTCVVQRRQRGLNIYAGCPSLDFPDVRMLEYAKILQGCCRQLSLSAKSYRRLFEALEHSLRHFLNDIMKIRTRRQCGEEWYNMVTRAEVAQLREKLQVSEKEKLEEKIRETHLQEEIKKLNLLLQNEKSALEGEKEHRLRIERDLMGATLEAGALRRKLERLKCSTSDFDPELLQIAFRNCSRELAKRTKRVQEMERQYQQVIPRGEFERLQKKYGSVSSFHQKLVVSHEELKMAHESIIEKFSLVTDEKKTLEEENTRLRYSATPRPDWNRVAEYIDGGIGKWKDLSSGKTSDELVEVLITEITGCQLSASTEFITCKGTDENVPLYLRYEGSVRNRKLSKRDLAILIDDIWKEKRKERNEDALAAFVDKYFNERYHIKEVRAEWCYSLADGCQRLAHEDQGFVQVEDFASTLKILFPLKAEDNIKTLIEKTSRCISHKDLSKLKYMELFSTGIGGIRSDFIQELLQQTRDEQDLYLQDILDELGYSVMDVSVEEMKRVFTIVDPRIGKEDIDSYLEWIFNCPKTYFKDCGPIPMNLLAARLQTGYIVRVGPKD